MKEKFLNKIIKNDYNNKLEEILSKKNFSEDVKNSLLSVLYNIESGYNDYKKVKRDAIEKKDYIEKLIEIIQNECNSIIFLNKKNDTNETIIDKNKKEIKCFPTPNNILYSISKIRNKNIVVDYLDKNIEEAICYLLDMGNNINFVEPLRDFNGFSWNIISNEIEDIKCNLIYQNLISLVGNEFLEDWIENYNFNNKCFDLFRKKIELKIGKQICQRIIFNIAHISVLIKASSNNEFKNIIINKIKEIKNELKKMDNKESYLSEISKMKKIKQKEIREIDKIINDNNLLKLEYENKNKVLSQEKKIFSIRVLKNIMIEERKEKVAEIDNLNNKMEPNYYFRLREFLNQIINIIEFNDEDISKKIEKTAIDLQKDIINCFIMEINKIENKEQLIEFIYKYRYYNLLPFSKENRICDIDELEENLNRFAQLLFEKAIEMKIIAKIYDNNDENVNLYKKIFITRIISLEDIYIKINVNNENSILIIYDEEIEENIINLSKNYKILMKYNKKMKLFT